MEEFMQNSRSIILGLALVLAVPAATPAQSQDRQTTSGEMKSVTCRVTNVNATEKSFTADCPDGTMTFTTTSSTQFMRSTSGAAGGGTASMNDLKTGDQVRVTYSGMGQGTGTGAGMKHNATRVEIMPGTTGGATGSGSSGSGSGQQQGTQTASQSGQQQGQYGQQAQQGQQKISGRVVSVNRQDRTLVIETAQGRETFKVEQGNTAVDFNSVREGEHVEITWQGSGAERRIASLRTVPGQQGEQQAASREQGRQPQEQRASQRMGGQAAGGQQQGNRVTGRIVSVNDTQLVIETSRGRETFQVDAQRAGLNLNQYKEGDQVQVTFTGTGTDRRITAIQASGERRAGQREESGDAAPASQRLPQTASEIPFIALVGLFMLAAAFGLRYVRRHV
jgi:hypothetical protein